MPDVTIIEGELAHIIIGACMKVHRILGPGLLEKCYENARK
jgi:GxxExxY protein